MLNVDVIYLYEHVAREYDVACAVKVLGEQLYGLKIELVQWPYGVAQATQCYRPRMVVLPFCYGATHYGEVMLHWRRAIFLNLAWEQLLYKGNSGFKFPKDRFARQHVIHHAWSKAYAAELEAVGVPAPHIISNGQPAYGLYDDPYRKYFVRREELATTYGLDPNRPWIFFPENYNWMFYAPERLDDFARQGGNATDITEMRDFSQRSFNEVMQWFAAVSDQTLVEVVVRPRPATAVDTFDAAVTKCLGTIPSHLHIIKAGTVREWIVASDSVMSSHSTALIEAAVAGKPAFMLEPLPIPTSLHVNWHGLLPHIVDRETCMDLSIGRFGEVDERLGSWARATLMSQGDPIANLARWLAHLLSGQMRVPPSASPSSAAVSVNYPLPGWLVYWYRQVRRHLRLRRPGPPQNSAYEMDLLGEDELDRRFARWRQILLASQAT